MLNSPYTPEKASPELESSARVYWARTEVAPSGMRSWTLVPSFSRSLVLLSSVYVPSSSVLGVTSFIALGLSSPLLSTTAPVTIAPTTTRPAVVIAMILVLFRLPAGAAGPGKGGWGCWP
ncbi:hypothetical protein AB4Z54_22410 [Streptomyces sp. MCAF7]